MLRSVHLALAVSFVFAFLVSFKLPLYVTHTGLDLGRPMIDHYSHLEELEGECTAWDQVS